MIAVAVLYTWTYNGTEAAGCWPSFSHRTQRTADFDLASQGSDNFTLPFWLLPGLWVVSAIIVVAVFGPSQLSRHDRQREPPQITRAPVADQAQAARYDDATA